MLEQISFRFADKTTVTLFELVNRALAEYARHGLFVLFASTNFQAADRGAHPTTFAYFARRDAVTLTPPFTEMPFDCHKTLLASLRPGTQRLKDVQEFAFIARFGRPL